METVQLEKINDSNRFAFINLFNLYARYCYKLEMEVFGFLCGNSRFVLS